MKGWAPRLGLKTRFKEEAKGNSEMAYLRDMIDTEKSECRC